MIKRGTRARRAGPGSAFDSHATPKYLMLESALAYLPRQATNGEQIQQSSLCSAPVLTDRQSASDIRMAEIEIGMATMFLLLNFYISKLRKETCTSCKFH